MAQKKEKKAHKSSTRWGTTEGAMSARRRERPVQSGSSNRSSARSARLSASKSAPNLAPGLPTSNNSRARAGEAGLASVRSEELWGEKAVTKAAEPATETARGTREGFMNEKKGYYCTFHVKKLHRTKNSVSYANLFCLRF